MKKPSPAATPTPSKQKPTPTPTKSESKPIPSTDKPRSKTQLFIDSIKESISVSDMKTLYPKSTSVKLQKRKAGPNKITQ